VPAFLDPTKTIATCTAESCEDCPAAGQVNCHFHGRQLAHFLLNALPPFVLAGACIVHIRWWWLLPWLLLAVAYFGLLEIRVMCSHCPHYAEPGTSLKCWANYGSPKLWKYRPGPMSRSETLWFFAGLAAVFIYPLPFSLIGHQWFLLALYLLSTAAAGATLKMVLCTRCMNFACPLNETDEITRQTFFERNPSVARAWAATPNPEDRA
jgi:hypothetical protein